MPHLNYVPTFHHTDWVDKLDRCDAEGPNGFNIRFDAITADLNQLSTVVGQIGSAIANFQAQPPPRQIQLSFTPMLRPTTVEGSVGWSYTATGVATASQFLPGATVGVMNLSLPDQYILTSLRLVGSIGGADSSDVDGNITLSRIPLRLTIPAATAQTVGAVFVGDGLQVGGFDVQQPPTAAFAKIDNSTYRYFLTALFDTSINGTMSIEMVQLTFRVA